MDDSNKMTEQDVAEWREAMAEWREEKDPKWTSWKFIGEGLFILSGIALLCGGVYAMTHGRFYEGLILVGIVAMSKH